jgi:hypothetical protein
MAIRTFRGKDIKDQPQKTAEVFLFALLSELENTPQADIN